MPSDGTIRPLRDGCWIAAAAAATTAALAGALAGQCLPSRPTSQHARVVDAIAATAAGRVILASQVRQAAWYERFSATPPPAKRAPAQLPPAACGAALDHLINEALIESAMPAQAPRPRLAAQLARLYPLYGGRAGLEQAWRRFHLRPKAARRIMRLQLALLNFLDYKFAARAKLAPGGARRYYRQVYLPLARRHHLQPAPLEKLRPLIAAILRRRQLARLEDAWLRRRRRRATINVRLHWPTARRKGAAF